MRKHRFILIIISFSVFIMSVNAQKMSRDEFRRNFNAAESLIDDGDFESAIQIYHKLVADRPNNANINFKMGFCYLNTVLDKEKAISYLEKAIKNVSGESTPSFYDESAAPIEAFVFLAKAYHQNYKFEKALVILDSIKTIVPNYQAEFTENIDLLEKYCKNGIKLMQHPIQMHITNLGGTINSEYDEHSPVFSADESILIFTSKRPNKTNKRQTDDGQYYEDIYISNNLGDGRWTTPVSISPNINTARHEASIGLSVDGSQLFIYRDDGNNIGNIYYSKLDGDKWTVPEKMGGEINSRFIETHASLSADGNELYFTSNRPGGYGGMDIYVVRKLPNGEWGKAENLGPNINTELDEEGPFIHPDGVTLFFSSKGHMSMGGFDIFFSIKDDEGYYTEPTNIGYPINTPADDVFYVPTPDGRRAYYASHQTGGIGRNDIYLITLPESEEKALSVISGIITLADGSPQSNVTITVTDIDNNDIIGVYTPNSKTGKYLFILKSGKNYNVTVDADGFAPFSENLMVEEGTSYQEVQRPINLGAIVLDGFQKSYDFHFKNNVSTLENIHLTEIPTIASIIKNVGTHTIEIILPSPNINPNLNDVRADIIKENLIDKGVDKQKISIIDKPKEENAIAIFIKVSDVLMVQNQPSKSIKGTLRNKTNNEVISDAKITISQTMRVDKGVASTTSNEKGEFYLSVDDLELDRLYLIIDKNNYEQAILTLDDASFETNLPLNISLIEYKDETLTDADILKHKEDNILTLDGMNIGGYILFDINKHETTEYNDNLDKLAEFLIKYPKAKVKAIGHTDNTGSINYNLALSERRVNFTRDYLIKKGVPRGQISTEFRGKSNPIALNISPESRAYNRRVEFILTPPDDLNIEIEKLAIPDDLKNK